MRITRVRIKNFRSIKDLDLPLSETTVLLGPNNAGKTAILDALRIALTRRWGQRGTGFTEYDLRLEDDTSDPKKAAPVEIEVELTERVAEEWLQEVHDELNDIVQIDPHTGCATIILRVTCSWDDFEEAYMPKWEFLQSNRAPFVGRGARAVNMSRFFEFIPVFYLDALRDADDEFKSRSQFWGRLLRSVNVPSALASRAEKIFDLLNTRFLAADPKVSRISDSLQSVTDVATEDDPGQVAIRVVPFKTWDLISRSQVILKNSEHHPWLPLSQHGRGVQSLSVVFVFHAFVSELLKELYREGSEAFLALEEPETHLHPQAARTLWRHVCKLPGQKVVTTHSPYFVQHVPFRDLRLIRGSRTGTCYSALKSVFSCVIPLDPRLGAYIALHDDRLSYDAGSGRFTINGRLTDDEFRVILPMYAGHPQLAEIQESLVALREESKKFVDDDTLSDLEEYARRIRGEIFFAKRWMLVEGQSDYILAHAIGDAAGYSLDANGVAVIDCKNNGDPRAFAVLARGLDIPWCAVFDNDDAGRKYLIQIAKAGFSPQEVLQRCETHSHGDMENQILAQGGGAMLREIAGVLGVRDYGTITEVDLIAALQGKKIDLAVEIAKRLDRDARLIALLPEAFVRRINAMRGLA